MTLEERNKLAENVSESDQAIQETERQKAEAVREFKKLQMKVRRHAQQHSCPRTRAATSQPA